MYPLSSKEALNAEKTRDVNSQKIRIFKRSKATYSTEQVAARTPAHAERLQGAEGVTTGMNTSTTPWRERKRTPCQQKRIRTPAHASGQS